MTPPPAPGERRGLSPLAWAGIGCGALALVAIVAFAFVVGWGVKKAKDFAEDPVALAVFLINQSPDVELAERDDFAETITIRNKADGKEITINYADIKNGNLSFMNEEGEFNFDIAQENGTLTIETPDATTMVGQGTDLTALPGWVPVYPGAEPQAVAVTTKADKAGGHFVISTPDSLDDVAAWFESQMAQAGLTANATKTPNAVVLQGQTPDGTRTIDISLSGAGSGTTAAVSFGE